MALEFTDPPPVRYGSHHAEAAAANTLAATEAILALSEALAGSEGYEKILVRAAAGAGKSMQLRRMVVDALAAPTCVRVAVTAFMNRQVWPLTKGLAEVLGPAQVCLFVSKDRYAEALEEVDGAAPVVQKTSEIPAEAKVVIGTAHKFGSRREYGRQLSHLGPAGNDEKPYDVLFVDEAWQMARWLFSRVEGLAPIVVGVGDVGQLPPIEASENPWRGDHRYNPYRAWPTAFEGDATTFQIDLPAVWRPHAQQLELWRAFYRDWGRLDCVAGPEDRTVTLPALTDVAQDVWSSVASGSPTLLEVEGLDEPEAPDVDQELLNVVEDLLEPLLDGGFGITEFSYEDTGEPIAERSVTSSHPEGDPLIVVLATRNAAVEDAEAMVERLTERFDLPERVITASTVDKWQGQTNRITVAVHPLSGADQLDDFNSAFGRLAVTCTRATHGLLIVSRAGIEELLADAPARPGTPLGEPGARILPRQTHQRILEAFSRGLLTVTPAESSGEPTGTLG